jgi:hypothetical protein
MRRAPGVTAMGFVVLVHARVAGAAGSAACDGPRVRADEGAGTMWAHAAASAEKALRSRRDVDRCVSVEVRASESVAVVRVSLPDGREATRRCAAPEDLATTLEPLVVVLAPRAPSPHTSRSASPRRGAVRRPPATWVLVHRRSRA